MVVFSVYGILAHFTYYKQDSLVLWINKNATTIIGNSTFIKLRKSIDTTVQLDHKLLDYQKAILVHTFDMLVYF